MIYSLTLFEQNSIYSDSDVFSTGNSKNILLYMSLMRFDKIVSISVLIYSVSFSFISCYRIIQIKVSLISFNLLILRIVYFIVV